MRLSTTVNADNAGVAELTQLVTEHLKEYRL